MSVGTCYISLKSTSMVSTITVGLMKESKILFNFCMELWTKTFNVFLNKRGSFLRGKDILVALNLTYIFMLSYFFFLYFVVMSVL
jgi:hypothetical protein